jgi:hypothetical protein
MPKSGAEMPDLNWRFACPILQVRSPGRSSEWMRSALGMEELWRADDDSYAVVGQGGARIHYSRCADEGVLKITAENMEFLLAVDDLDSAWAAFQSQAEDFGHSPPELRPWGVREFHLYGPDHELIRVAQSS